MMSFENSNIPSAVREAFTLFAAKGVAEPAPLWENEIKMVGIIL